MPASLFDPRPLPMPPFARCPSCGEWVAVLFGLDCELMAHRRPLPDGTLCEYPRRVHRRDVTSVLPPSGR